MNIAIIPARGGSKRIPKKNIKEFYGKPLIAYSIGVAKKSELFDKIIVSTDDENIAKIAAIYGADILERPKELADDFTGTTPVVAHAIVATQKNIDELKSVCCIYATAPFLEEKYLKEGHAKLLASNSRFVFSATTFEYPIQRALKISGEMFYPEYLNSRSQDLEEAFHDAGQFYFGTPKAWLERKIMFSKESLMIQIPRYLVQDIDTLEDWKRAELMYRALYENPF
ncbi:MAG: pseudaminic acid cytidylyltransferase [Campylobacteraceae bacterium]|nr:pseudaminic acid cytidylyltransferase [Campylobacteraceae bacterium]